MTSVVAAAVVIVGRDLRAALRSGYFVVMGVATPIVLAVVFHVVFSGVTSGNLGIAVGYIDRDASSMSAPLGDVLRVLDDDGLLAVTELAATTDPRDALDEHELRAVVVVPDGFEASVVEGGSPGDRGHIEVSADPDAPISAGVVRAVVSNYTLQLDRDRLAAAAADEVGVAPPTDWGRGTVTTRDVGAADRLDIGARLGASMSSLFILIVALMGVTSLLYERDAGTLARLLAAPIPSASVVVAKVVLSVLLAAIAGLAVAIATSVVIGASWGPPVGVAAVVIGFALAATGITVLVTGAARSAASASAIQSTAAVLLAVLGGGFVPIPQGGLLGFASRLTPHYWFIEGLDAMTGATWREAMPSVLVLVAIAVVLGVPGLWLTRRRLTL